MLLKTLDSAVSENIVQWMILRRSLTSTHCILPFPLHAIVSHRKSIEVMVTWVGIHNVPLPPGQLRQVVYNCDSRSTLVVWHTRVLPCQMDLNLNGHHSITTLLTLNNSMRAMYNVVQSIELFTGFRSIVDMYTNERTHNVELETSEIDRSILQTSFGRKIVPVKSFSSFELETLLRGGGKLFERDSRRSLNSVTIDDR